MPDIVIAILILLWILSRFYKTWLNYKLEKQKIEAKKLQTQLYLEQEKTLREGFDILRDKNIATEDKLILIKLNPINFKIP